ncbi:MobC family plasmid mobilization relaxosome protein [Dysgonomonas termitidis]|uniref:MobC family plasmid mobilization relaxosome protein n=1 Tax=Dysgonomonas termitidis TaxID=1516126 RepID=A0ABV9L3E6_9BACT
MVAKLPDYEGKPVLLLPMVASITACWGATLHPEFSIILNANVMENKEDNKSKKGRPAKEKAKLSCSINLKLTEVDFNAVKEKAGKLGMKPTQYAREMTLKGGIKSRFTIEELDLIRKLSGMSNNLNQIAKQVNKSGFFSSATDVIMIADEIKKLFHDS